MKTVKFKEDYHFWPKGTVTTLDDTLADQLLKEKKITLNIGKEEKAEETNTAAIIVNQ